MGSKASRFAFNMRHAALVLNLSESGEWQSQAVCSPSSRQVLKGPEPMWEIQSTPGDTVSEIQSTGKL